MTFNSVSVALPAPPPLRFQGSALFLDLDGTLAAIVARPQDVRPDARRTRLLERLVVRFEGRLAIVTGRTMEDVDRILEGCIPSVAAVHGLVMREGDGRVHGHEAHPGVAKATAALRDIAGRHPGLIVEEKGLSVALHYRLARGHAAEARAAARSIADKTGLSLQEGDMVEELRTPGPSKGDSIRAFMETERFRGARPIFAGDDITDEHGFAEVIRLGGFGVLVGRPRPTHAQFGLRNVEDVLAWLEAAR